MYSLEYEGVIFLAGAGFMVLLNLLILIASKIKLGSKDTRIWELENDLEELQHQLDLEHDEKIQLMVLNAGLKGKNTK